MYKKFRFRSVALMAALAMVLVIAAACGSDDDEVSSSSSTTTSTSPAATATVAPTSVPAQASAPLSSSAQATPTAAPPAAAVVAKVDRLVFGVAMDGETNFSLRSHPGFATFMAMKPMYEWLVGIDSTTGAFYPMLASAWAITGGDTLTYTIREGIQFHDGYGEFTADDALVTYEQQFHPLSEHYFFGNVDRNVDRVEATDTQFIVYFKNPDPEFLWNWSEISLGGEIISRNHFEEQGGEPPNLGDQAIAGTGSYRFLERKEGQYIRFGRVDDHWRKTADFKEFEWRILNENSTRLAALLTGEIHMAPIPVDNFGETNGAGMKNVTSKVKGNRIFLRPLCCYYADGGGFQHESALQILEVRKAINKAIDKDALNDAFFNGEADLSFHAHLSDTNLGWNPEWKTRYTDEYGYDPAAAKALLAEAGFGPDNPARFTLNVSAGGLAGDNSDMTEIIGGMLQDVGIEIDLHQWNAAIDGARQRNFEVFNDLSMFETSANPFIAEGIYTRHFLPSANSYSTLEIDALGLATRIMDPAIQEGAWRAWGNAVYDEHLVFPLFYDNPVITVNPEFVADWPWPGHVSATWTHVEYIQAAQ